MNPLNYMRLHDHLGGNPRQYWENTSNGKISIFCRHIVMRGNSPDDSDIDVAQPH